MARTGPRRNQWTGPVRPQTPPSQIHPLDPYRPLCEAPQAQSVLYPLWDPPEDSGSVDCAMGGYKTARI